MAMMKPNTSDDDAKLLKSCSWILLESIYYLPEMTNFILPLSNIPWRLLHIYLLQITIQECILDIQLEQWQRQIDNNKNRILMEFKQATGEKSQSNPRHRSEYNFWKQVWPYTDPLNHLDDTVSHLEGG